MLLEESGFAHCMAVDQGLSKSFLPCAAYVLLIHNVVAVIKTEVSIQSQVPVCSQWGGLLHFILASFKHFLNPLACCS